MLFLLIIECYAQCGMLLACYCAVHDMTLSAVVRLMIFAHYYTVHDVTLSTGCSIDDHD